MIAIRFVAFVHREMAKCKRIIVVRGRGQGQGQICMCITHKNVILVIVKVIRTVDPAVANSNAAFMMETEDKVFELLPFWLDSSSSGEF